MKWMTSDQLAAKVGQAAIDILRQSMGVAVVADPEPYHMVVDDDNTGTRITITVERMPK